MTKGSRQWRQPRSSSCGLCDIVVVEPVHNNLGCGYSLALDMFLSLHWGQGHHVNPSSTHRGGGGYDAKVFVVVVALRNKLTQRRPFGRILIIWSTLTSYMVYNRYL